MDAWLSYASERVVPLPPAKAWEVFSDTDHFNRFVGLPRVTYATGSSPLVRAAAARMAGLSLRWAEYPFEWVEARRLSVRRVYETGPAREVAVGIELDLVPGGTRVRFHVRILPRLWLVRPICAVLAQQTLAGFGRYCEELLRRCAEEARAARGPVPQPAGVDRDKLTAALQRAVAVRPVQSRLLARFERHLAEAGDDEVLGMRPYALADAWRESRAETLSLFLQATRAGALTLEWQLMCPNCRVAKAGAATLRDMQPSYHCDLCGVQYDTDLERYTELRFSVHPEVRHAELAVYCIGSPARSSHVLAQRYLAPGEEARLSLLLPAEALRARAVRSNEATALTPLVDGGAGADAAVDERGRLELVYRGGGWGAEGETRFSPGEVELTLRNASAAPALLVVERTRLDPAAVTAAEVTALQEFRSLFSGEVLAPGAQLGVRTLSVLFTDLRRSTELYEQVGDATAFSRVQRHFEFIMLCVAGERGAVVKTIGDAVMAVFPTPVAAVRAALRMQQRLPGFNRDHGLEPPLVLKVGVHVGPAIAINANGAFDYFGRTVNLAARVQGESEGGDVVMSDDVAQRPEVRAELAATGAASASYEARLRGFGETFKLWRVVPAPADCGEVAAPKGSRAG